MKKKKTKIKNIILAICLAAVAAVILFVLFGGRLFKKNSRSDSIGEGKNTCYLEIRCDTILKNMDMLSKEKHELVPEDGVILPVTKVKFNDGESVFDILSKAAKDTHTHLEFMESPLYGSSYIEGINNIYEFDCGALSGWMYSVNGQFPMFGCSEYKLKDGDEVKFVFTCDMGEDVGNGTDGM